MRILRAKEKYHHKMVVEAAKVYDAQARIFVLVLELIGVSDLEIIRDITNEISNCENVIEINQEKLDRGIYQKALKSENIPSKINREFMDAV